MKVVIAPNAFKDSLSALEVAKAIAEGLLSVEPKTEIKIVPVADGGDGLVEIAIHALKAETIKCPARDPLLRPIQAEVCFLPDKKIAIIEMASASGLRLLEESERNPLLTSTAGVGDMILKAFDLGAEKILIGLGGSATNDGGCGMAEALGARFLDEGNKAIHPFGGQLDSIAKIDLDGLDQRIKKVEFQGICDVTNPLLGEQGAAYVYGPQKGASPEHVKLLDSGLTNLAGLLEEILQVPIANISATGAAGGLGAGLIGFLGADLKPGIDIVLDLVELKDKLIGCDLVLTGEGKIDNQTAYGKAPAGVANLAKANGIPCIALVGARAPDISELYSAGFTSVFSLCPGPIPLNEAISEAKTLLKKETEQVFRTYLAGKHRG